MQSGHLGLRVIGDDPAAIVSYQIEQALRQKAKELGIENNLQVERLDILDPFDVSNALR